MFCVNKNTIARIIRPEQRAEAILNSRRWYEANPERRRAYAREYYAAHPEPAKANVRLWAKSHREQSNRSKRRWAQANPEYLQMNRERYRAASVGAEGSGYTAEQWSVVLSLWSSSCCYCARSFANTPNTIDHIVPLTAGGSHFSWNLAPACKSCNSSKGNNLLADWRNGEHVSVQQRAWQVSVLVLTCPVCDRVAG